MSKRQQQGNSPAFFLKACRSGPVPLKKLTRLVREIYCRESVKPGRLVTVIFCSDKAIRRLNAAYRHKDKPTDVLSFEFIEKDFLGQIYISLERAAVQARRYGCAYHDELERLLIHGMFHLLGFDHKNRGERAIMEKKEQRYRPDRFDQYSLPGKRPL